MFGKHCLFIGACAIMLQRFSSVSIVLSQTGRRVDTRKLYPRAWSESVTCSGGIPLRLAQFNILADGLSGQDQNLGGFTESPRESLHWQFRRGRLIEELMRHGDAPDVIALQEVDHFQDSFEPDLEKLGYEGVFVKKPNSKCRTSLDPTLEDGCALFWRKDKARVLKLNTFEYDSVDVNGMVNSSKSNQVAILATLQVNGASPVLVAVSHLIAKKTAAGELQRAAQVRQLLQKVREERAIQQQDLSVVIAMDMNAAPEMSQIAHYPPEAYPAMLRNGTDVGLYSVYSRILGGEPPFTTWKRRGVHEAKHTIDYIFASAEVQVSGVLLPPEEDSVVAERLPGWNYPSDHVALMADLRLPNL